MTPFKQHKYKAQKALVDDSLTLFRLSEIKENQLDVHGIQFDSITEAQYYIHLKHLQLAGEIKEIQVHPVYVLQEKPLIKYIADFLVTFSDNTQVVLDVKGVQTASFRLKKRMFQHVFPHLTLRLVKKSGKRWTEKDCK